MIEIEVQNETHQSQHSLRFAAVPRIGEGLRLREPDGRWASYDVLDVWYQKAEFGDVWMPYLHVCMTPEEQAAPEPQQQPRAHVQPPVEDDYEEDYSDDDAYPAPAPTRRPQAVSEFASLLPRQEAGQ